MLPPPGASCFILSPELQKALDDSALGVLSCPKSGSFGELSGKDGRIECVPKREPSAGPLGSLEMGRAVAVASPGSPGRLWRSHSRLGTVLAD